MRSDTTGQLARPSARRVRRARRRAPCAHARRRRRFAARARRGRRGRRARSGCASHSGGSREEDSHRRRRERRRSPTRRRRCRRARSSTRRAAPRHDRRCAARDRADRPTARGAVGCASVAARPTGRRRAVAVDVARPRDAAGARGARATLVAGPRPAPRRGRGERGRRAAARRDRAHWTRRDRGGDARRARRRDARARRLPRPLPLRQPTLLVARARGRPAERCSSSRDCAARRTCSCSPPATSRCPSVTPATSCSAWPPRLLAAGNAHDHRQRRAGARRRGPRLMLAFHRRLAGGASPASALAEAQAGLRADQRALAGFLCLGAG